MKAYREDMPFSDERRSVFILVIAAAAVLAVCGLLYFGLRTSDEPATPASSPVVRDSATVVPPVVDTNAPTAEAQPTAQAPAAERRDLTERPLASPRTTVGAGAAPVTGASTGDSAEAVVITGELLEDLEAQAEAEAAQQ
ncbi:MAG: hypothetical protein RLZZ227_1434 [Pseudomonadota bacterium]|jgi:hypothetical protein